MAYLLKQASTSFLILLHQWIGLLDSSPMDEDMSIHHQPWADLGIFRIPLRGGTREARSWQYDFTPKMMPGFISKADKRTLFEAGRSLRQLREASDLQHPLCKSDWGIRADWVWGEQRSSGYVWMKIFHTSI